MIDSSPTKRNKSSSFQPPFIIAIIPIANFPFPVLVIAATSGTQEILEGKLLFESFSLHGICRQQVGACLFFGKKEYLRTAIVVEDNP